MSDLSRLLPQGVSPVIGVLAQLFWLVQIALIIHVYRTGRPYWWIWILFAAPMIGGLAYAAVEMLPEARNSRGRWHALKPAKWRIADRRQTLEETETIENRLALAEELFDCGKAEEAHEVAAESLRGVFKDDPHTMAAVARYKLALGRHSEAHSLLERINTTADQMLRARVAVMRADCLRGLGRYAEAEYAYASVLSRYIGEAPRAGLALVYEQTGREEKAREIWTEIRTKFRRANPSWRKNERAWYRMATAKLNELEA